MNTRPPSELVKIVETDQEKNVVLQSIDVMEYNSSFSLFKFFNNLPESFWLDKLAYHLAQVPDEERVKFILKRDLKFLNFVFKKVEFPLYTVTNVTPLQLVHGAGNNVMRDETLVPLFAERYGSFYAGIKEMEKQISEMKDVHTRFNFDPIIKAISNESFKLGKDAATDKWILSPAFFDSYAKFRNDYEAIQPKIIDKGMQFRWETLKELLDSFSNAAVLWSANNYQLKCALFADAVLAEVLRYATKYDKRRFNQGLSYPDKTKTFKHITTDDEDNFDQLLKKPSPDFFHLESSCIDIVNGAAWHSNGIEAWVQWLVGAARTKRPLVNIARLTSEHVTKFLSDKNFKPDELMHKYVDGCQPFDVLVHP